MITQMRRFRPFLIFLLLFSIPLIACSLSAQDEGLEEEVVVVEIPQAEEEAAEPPPTNPPPPTPTPEPEPPIAPASAGVALQVVNATADDICGAIIYDYEASDDEGILLFEDVLPAGSGLTFSDIDAGTYDLLAFDCNDEDVDYQEAIELGSDDLVWSVGVGVGQAETTAAVTESTEAEDETAEAPDPTGPVSNDDLRRIDFGAFPGGVAELSFTLQPGDVSAHISAVTDDPLEFITLTSIIDPNGQSLYSLDFESFETNSELFPVPVEDTGAVGLLLPPAPQFDLVPGEYRVVFETEASGIANVAGVIKTGDINLMQAIDFNVWLVTADASLIQEAARAEMEAAMRTEVNRILSPHNMQLGKITFISATQADIDQYAQYINADELSPLCFAMANAVGTERSVNIALVDALLDADGNDDGTAGISTGLPGSIFLAESPRSCVAAAWQIYDTYPEHAANWFHEGSHFMGLPHTTESDGLSFDGFLDTPECPYDQYDTNGDGEVDDFECDIAGGAKNYMFYSGVPEFAPFEMSADQAWALRRHPWFYPVAQ